MLLFFVFLLILGFILFIIAVFFYRRKGGVREYREDSYVSLPVKPQEKKESDRVRVNSYIPVLHRQKKIPGIKEFELIHYIGSGALFTIETKQEPSEIILKEGNLVPEIEGRVILTSHKLMIYNAKTVKKIVYGAIGKYAFHDPFLIIMRKDVKKKKDVLRVLEKPSEFKYIFTTLT